ncbi:unnamed protein product [Sphenostylis stenocarpa]|uniref:Uncharacterized protein n=1 Tax=Sphenostylis stenocarpa TaxID=92480 RepID=A0AA86T1T0_9FABA|nr:unnamed protein product [Sphenostylis stenocarpa]
MQRSRAVQPTSRWIFAGGHQLRCDLVPPTACLVSCRRNTPDLRLYLRGTVKFAISLSYKELRSYMVHIFSHRYGSYVVFHGCNLKLVYWYCTPCMIEVKIGSYCICILEAKLGNDGSKNWNEKLEPISLSSSLVIHPAIGLRFPFRNLLHLNEVVRTATIEKNAHGGARNRPEK